MGKRSSLIITMLALLLAITAILAIALIDWQPPGQQAIPDLSEEALAELINEGEISALWYNRKEKRVYGRYGSVSDSVDNLPRKADFCADISQESFWNLTKEFEENSQGLASRNNIVVGYVQDPQTIWQRYRDYWIFSICLLLLAAAFILWLRFTHKRKKNGDNESP